MFHFADPGADTQYRDLGWWSSLTLSDRVNSLAAEKSEGIAYHWGEATLTWRGYSELANRIAERVVADGLARGERVLVWLPDGGAVHAAYLGCERAGVVAVGAGWRAGLRELAYLTERTGARIAVLTAQSPLGAAADVAARLGLRAYIIVEDLDDVPTVADGPTDGKNVDLSGRAVGASELWLLNSTSGTTGLPKCVMQTINRWVYFHHKAVEFADLGHDEVFMSVLPAPFGFGLWTAHVSPTLLGIPCVVQARFDPGQAAADIEQHRVTVLAAVSSQFVMILNSAGDRDLSSLRVLFTGGEAISSVRAREFEQRTGCRVLNFYGSNETGLLSGTRLSDPLEQRLTTGGRVVAEMQVRLYGTDGQRVPGDRGEGRPACKGPATALGYWDDDAANRELFTDDGWMFMGDIVRIDNDDWLNVVARTADFIIRGGKNISAPAVEEEVATHPCVALAAAVAVPDERVGERVGVFVELRTDCHLTLADLTEHLALRGVSREWWPERLWVLAELPRSSGGKVAKGELRERARQL